jgi:cell division protein ZapA (FtsZ GTPase activity inhibitor)
MTWLLVALGIVAALGLLLCICALSGRISQAEEDEHGVELARRS